MAAAARSRPSAPSASCSACTSAGAALEWIRHGPCATCSCSHRVAASSSALARDEGGRIEPAGGMRARERVHLGARRLRAAAREDERRPSARHVGFGVVARRRGPAGARVLGQAERDAGAAHQQRQVARRLREDVQVLVVGGVGDRVADAVRPQSLDGGVHGLGAEAHERVRQQAHLVACLPAEHAHEAGVAHRGERVIAHRRVRQELRADEQVPLVHRAAVGGEGRAHEREIAAQRVEQRVGHGADVAGVGRVEGRADLEQEPVGAARPQPGERAERLLDRLADRRRARLQRDHDRVGLRQRQVGARNAVDLHRAQAALRQRVGQVGGAGEVIGDASEGDAPSIELGQARRRAASARRLATSAIEQPARQRGATGP